MVVIDQGGYALLMWTSAHGDPTGQRVRVSTRSGKTVEGVCLGGWALHAGGHQWQLLRDDGKRVYVSSLVVPLVWREIEPQGASPDNETRPPERRIAS